MKFSFKNILYIAFICIFSSCTPRLFFPDRAVTTAFTEKNQFLINGSIKPQNVVYSSNGTDSFRSKGASYSFDAAYAISKSFAISGYFSNVNDRGTSQDLWNSIGNLYNGNRAEIGMIYFKPVSKNWIGELSAAFGKGQIQQNGVFNNFGDYYAKYNTYTIQGAYSFKTDYFNVSMGSKIWLQHYYQFQSNSPNVRNYFLSEGLEKRDITQYPFVFASIFYNFEYGYKYIKFNTQIGTPFQLSRPTISGFPFYLTMGIVLRFEEKYFQISKKTSLN